MTHDSKISFWQYLSRNYIEIPIIQRDYAQGREGKEYIRRSFLRDLHNALTNAAAQPLKLDFVYGSEKSMCGDKGAVKQLPLDGQQRLTTLWLLHWYVALQNPATFVNACGTLSKFSYETRLSSREFCESLCCWKNFVVEAEKGEYKHLCDNADVVSYIKDSTWFRKAWLQDPTIDAMLRMLSGSEKAEADGIAKVFKGSDNFDDIWERLTGDAPMVFFYHLPLKDFGLTDDLYVKMNARGKSLSSFENFKADLLAYICSPVNVELQPKLKKFQDATEGLGIKIDTDWTDIFWRKKSQENTIDESFYIFLKRFFRNYFFMYKDAGKYVLPVGEVRSLEGKRISAVENSNETYSFLKEDSSDNALKYEGIEPFLFRYCQERRGIPAELFEELETVLDRFYNYINQPNVKVDPEAFDSPWGEKFYFIPQYDDRVASKILTLSQPHQVVFFAVCKYLKEGVVKEMSLKRWMRVVWNLVSGYDANGDSTLDHVPDMRKAMELLGQLNSHNPYSSLKKEDKSSYKDSILERRFVEEIEKACQILDDDGNPRIHKSGETWEEVIIRAEKWNGFRGSIGFLFHDEKESVDWNNFDKRFDRIKSLFKEKVSSLSENNPFNKEAEAKYVLCSLVSNLNEGEEFCDALWNKKIFRNTVASWLQILTGSEFRQPVNMLLLSDKTEINNSSSASNSREAKAQSYLSDPNFVDCLFGGDYKDYCFREMEGRYCLYSHGKRIYLNYPERDEFLLNTPEIKVGGQFVIPKVQLLNSWDVWFEFSDGNQTNYFWWDRWGWVYLADSDDTHNRTIRAHNAESDEEKFYCFGVENGNQALRCDEIIDKMEELIAQKAADDKSALVQEDISSGDA